MKGRRWKYLLRQSNIFVDTTRASPAGNEHLAELLHEDIVLVPQLVELLVSSVDAVPAVPVDVLAVEGEDEVLGCVV